MSIVMMITLLVGSATVATAAICRHHSAQEHEAALRQQGRAAAVAQMEDAARAAAKAGTIADYAMNVLGAYVAPTPPPDFAPAAAAPARFALADEAALPDHPSRPLLEPPAA